MKWHWKVRLYRDNGDYYHANVVTDRDLEQINTIQDFYLAMTGCKMLLEGMSETPFVCPSLPDAFSGCWRR